LCLATIDGGGGSGGANGLWQMVVVLEVQNPNPRVLDYRGV